MTAVHSEKIKIRGLVHIAAAIFGVWGFLVGFKGLYDLMWGEPEANLYSAFRWQFVTQEQWLRYAGFEFVYGWVCLALAYGLVRYARFLPETVERPHPPKGFGLFD